MRRGGVDALQQISLLHRFHALEREIDYLVDCWLLAAVHSAPRVSREVGEPGQRGQRQDAAGVGEPVYSPSSSASLLGVAAMRLISHSIAELDGIC